MEDRRFMLMEEKIIFQYPFILQTKKLLIVNGKNFKKNYIWKVQSYIQKRNI